MLRIDEYRSIIEDQLQMIGGMKRPEGLYEPVKYILSLGGKRLRPVLCLASAGLFGDYSPALMPALGLEVFHNFTLLHDDIMDRSDVRRNHETVHKRWDDNTAILSGDLMLIKSYELISKSPVGVLPQVLEVFNKTAIEVCEGQQFDMEFEKTTDVTEEGYLDMIRLKTAVLIGASMKIGGILGGGSLRDCSLLYKFGQDIGMAFQLQDDWLDVFGNQETFGKQIGSDILNNKKTFLLISTLNRLEKEPRKQLLDWLERKDYNADEKIAAVTQLYNEAGVSEIVTRKRDDFFFRSLENFEKINGDQEIKKEIENFAHKLMARAR
ncbi:MAG: geranylgeranyl diphosphate synthase, type [Anaerophaga sp.]|uniref:polyprenyl synthetase family protein n=1 Tax=Anaerophaga thermohalophila TaxID=177400 RepID=UPI000237CABC|nr:polyprenyl synthetase family protein [Anaerophaga thermohalophila]MDI3520827.1 geranylgeranyl diphosphate synthase, type [Anaerophaga sp.]MDK2841604.1 geranylgeranyl diphosphate synthase, type [Anaerophaga sp.]MDN5292223.1 geranylgeranyl diphosphate synthase, type [Anaerophaga sp.]